MMTAIDRPNPVVGAHTDTPFPVAIRAIDPSTAEVAVPGAGIERVRLIGTDTAGPVVPGQETGCMFDEAKRFIRTRVPGGSPVLWVANPTQPDRDADGWLLRL